VTRRLENRLHPVTSEVLHVPLIISKEFIVELRCSASEPLPPQVVS
jgi:hypothetical protein